LYSFCCCCCPSSSTSQSMPLLSGIALFLFAHTGAAIRRRQMLSLSLSDSFMAACEKWFVCLALVCLACVGFSGID
jgi:hypothetical protein